MANTYVFDIHAYTAFTLSDGTPALRLEGETAPRGLEDAMPAPAPREIFLVDERAKTTRTILDGMFDDIGASFPSRPDRHGCVRRRAPEHDRGIQAVAVGRVDSDGSVPTLRPTDGLRFQRPTPSDAADPLAALRATARRSSTRRRWTAASQLPRHHDDDVPPLIETR